MKRKHALYEKKTYRSKQYFINKHSDSYGNKGKYDSIWKSHLVRFFILILIFHRILFFGKSYISNKEELGGNKMITV